MTESGIKQYRPEEEEEKEIDLRQILKLFKKWGKFIIVMTLICGLSAVIVSKYLMVPIYEAHTLLMVTLATDKLQGVPTSARGENDLGTAVNSVSSLPVLTMNTYLGQIKSEALMQMIIAKLGLKSSPAGLAAKIDASIEKDSNLIKVKVTHSDPILASRIANTLNDEYLQLTTEKNQEQMSRSVTFLASQKQITDKDLQTAQEALKNYQSQPRGIDVLEAEFTKKTTDFVEYGSRLKTVGVEIMQTQAGINSLSQDLAAVPKMIGVEKIDSATGAVIRTQEINPLYVSTAQSLAAKNEVLAEKQSENEELTVLVASMEQELNILQAELAQRRMDQDNLQREVDRLKETSETLAKKVTETQIAKSVDLGNTSMMVVSAASIPTTPVKPDTKLNVAIAMVLGLMLFSLLAFVLDYLDNTLKTPEDVTRELQLPVLGLIPKINDKTRRQSYYGGKS